MPTIQQGLARILKYGNFNHKKIINNILASKIALSISSNSNSGQCGVINQVSTQEKVLKQKLSEIDALGELHLDIDPLTANTYPGIEGTLVHETRHAYHMARCISEISYDKAKYYNLNGFEIEYSANVAYVEYIKQAIKLNHPDKQALIDEAVNILRVAKKLGNTIVIDEKGIRTRLSSPAYNVNDTTQKGKTFSDHWNIYPKHKLFVSAGIGVNIK